MSEATTEIKETQPEQEAAGKAEAAQLTLNDLAAMKSIIDIASQRGTFKPTEMIVVGQTYTKLVAFLDSVKQSQGE
jgi:hypothetical protein